MFSYYHECYKGTPAYNAATAMPVILENGRKVFGPPHKYCGPRPSHVCELYVTHIPTQLDELGFLVWLHRIGPVYAFRLMMDTGNTTRGYAFVRFCSEKDALAAIELLKYLYVDGERLGVFRSQGKNRLFVSGIPRQLQLSSLEDGFKLCFPRMQSCTAYPPLKSVTKTTSFNDDQNRGFAFIEFEDHETALAAKKRLTPGRVRMWGVDLKIQWAKPKEELQDTVVSKKMQGEYVYNRNIQGSYQPSDFCAKLRLYCLANNLCVPVVLYGHSCRQNRLQYAGILFKNSFTGYYSYLIFEVIVSNIYDVHLIICEVAVKMIEKCFGEFQQHVLFRVVSDTKVELVSTFKNYDDLMRLNLKNNFIFDNAITELATSLEILALQNHEKLLLFYKRSFLTSLPVATFCLDVQKPLAQFCSVLPKFRNNSKLNNNFNNLEIILLLTPSSDQSKALVYENNRLIDLAPCTTNDFIMLHRQQQMLSQQYMKKCQYFNLRSQHCGYGIDHILRYVDKLGLELRECYHPAQRVNSNPIWIAGQSYQQSIYN